MSDWTSKARAMALAAIAWLVACTAPSTLREDPRGDEDFEGQPEGGRGGAQTAGSGGAGPARAPEDDGGNGGAGRAGGRTGNAETACQGGRSDAGTLDASGGSGIDGTAGASVTRGLVGHWRMDEGVGQVIFDATKNGNNGSIHYDHAWTDEGFSAARFPNAGALEAGGDNTKVTWGGWSPPKMPQRTEVIGLPALGSPMTATFWMKPRRVDVRQGLWLFLSGGAPRLGLELGADGRFRLTGGTLNATGGSPSSGRWQHVALVFDGTRATVYLDGRAVVTAEGAPGRGTIVTMTMGKVGSDAFGGTLDDARLYDRALVPDEIAILVAGD